MKSITFKFLIVMMCLFISDISFAQKSARKKKTTNSISLAYCEDAIEAAKKTNQAQADAECRTVHQCVPCQEKKSKKETCKPITVQPTCTSALVVVKKEAVDVAGKTVDKQPFTVEIIQKPCNNGMVSIDAVVIADEQVDYDKKTQQAYDFEWTIDGKIASKTSSISCLNIKEAKVKISQKSGGGLLTLYIAPVSEQALTSRGAPIPAIATAYKKTGCFGQCPIYEVQFFHDGRIRWEGKMNVGTMGIKETKVDKETLEEIERMADKIKFFQMERKYPDYQVWDAPSTFIYVNINGKEHQVEDILDAPQELKEFEKFFDDLIKKQGWRTTPDKKAKTAKMDSNN
ncbi:MAG: hypothetical protein GC192_20085 [Bacteroidetes bacterium]|nr:hypothetical protein [Bacteroidota bacterium]